MRKRIIISLFLLAAFCVKSALAQEEFVRNERINSEIGSNKPLLYTEFVELKNLYLKTRPLVCWGSAPKDMLAEYESSDKLFLLLRKMLSPRGAIEHDDRKGILIITDEKGKINIISKFVKLLDESGFTLEEIVSNLN
jgi:hypothetical protein